MLTAHGHEFSIKYEMDWKHIAHIQEWFYSYAESFIEKFPHSAEELHLKKEHSLRVMSEMETILEELACSEALSLAARIGALLHDVGRFEQYVRYGTFADAHSEDHALLGLKVIRQHAVLEQIQPYYAEMIRFAITHHNKLLVPCNTDEETQLMAKMLRDSDKIDILRVVTIYYQKGDAKSVSAMLNLPDDDSISDVVCRDVLNGKMPDVQDLASSNDLKLLQMSWIYDINFPVSLRIIKEHGYIDILKGHLPDVPVIEKIYNKVNSQMDHMIHCCN